MTAHALVIGEALVDVVVRQDGPAVTHPGGSPANVALGLARLGREVELLAHFSDDANGELVREHLEASGVELAQGTLDAERTSVATAHLDASGAATYEFELEWAVSAGAAPREAPLVVHTGSIAAVLQPGADDVRRIVSELRATATVTYDPNARPSLMGDPADARVAVEQMVALADVVKVSDEDLAWLAGAEVGSGTGGHGAGAEVGSGTGGDGTGGHGAGAERAGGDAAVEDVARGWLTLGPALVVITRGGEGATALTASGRELTIAAPQVDVADTVGAGDSFMGGLVDGLWSAGVLGRERRAALDAIDDATLTGILERCARIAAITVSRAGANPPGSAELGE